MGRSAAIEARDLVEKSANDALKELDDTLKDILATAEKISKLNISLAGNGGKDPKKETTDLKELSAVKKEMARIQRELIKLEAKHQIWLGKTGAENEKLAKQEKGMINILKEKYALEEKARTNDKRNASDKIKHTMAEVQAVKKLEQALKDKQKANDIANNADRIKAAIKAAEDEARANGKVTKSIIDKQNANKHLNSVDRIKQAMSERQEVERLKRETEALTKALKGNSKTVNDARNANKSLKTARDGINATTVKGQSQIKKMNALIKKNTEFIRKNTGEVKKQRTAWDSVKRYLAVGAIIAAAKQLYTYGKALFELVKAYDRMNFTMAKIFQNTYDLIGATGFLKDIVNKFGLDLRVVTQQYVKFNAAGKAAGLTTLDIEKIFKSTSKAAAVMGLRTDELKGVYLALEQMMSKGKVTTEELRRQLGERLPGAVNIMAKSMGVTVAELDKMLKKGEVLSAEVLPRFAEELEREYNITALKEIHNLTAETNRLTTAWEQFWTALIDSEGTVVKSLLSIFGVLKGGLELLTKYTETDKAKARRVSEIEMSKTVNTVLFKRTKDEGEFVRKLEQGNLSLEERTVLVDKLRKNQVALSQDKLDAEKEALKAFDKRYKVGKDAASKYLKGEVADDGTVSIEQDASKIKAAQSKLLEIELQRAKITGRIAAYKKLAEISDNNAANNEDSGDGDKAFKKRYLAYLKLIGLETKLVKLAEIKRDILRRSVADENELPEIRITNLKKLAKAEVTYLDAKESKERKQRENWYRGQVKVADNFNAREQDRVNELVRLKKMTQEEADAYMLEKNAEVISRKGVLAKDYEEWLTKITKDYEDKRQTNARTNAVNLYELKMKLLQKQSDALKSGINKEEAEDRQELNDAFVSGRLSAIDYYVEVENLEREQHRRSLILSKEMLESQRDALGVGDSDYSKKMDEVTEKIAEVNEAISLIGVDTLEETREKTVAIFQVIGDFNNEIGSLFDVLHSRRMEQINAEKEAELSKFDSLYEAAKGDADAKEALKKEEDAINEKYDKKKRKLERDNAIRQKAQALITIAINTAMAIARAPVEGGILGAPALIAIVAALGAIQTATVLSQPLPRLKEGRKGGIATFAVVGDGGKREVIERKDGSVGVTPNRDTITWLNDGDKVHKSISEYRRSITMDNTSRMGDGDIDLKGIENAIEVGFSKAKINNNTTVESRIDINHSLWINQQLHFDN